jgi:hypothetical protein
MGLFSINVLPDTKRLQLLQNMNRIEYSGVFWMFSGLLATCLIWHFIVTHIRKRLTKTNVIWPSFLFILLEICNLWATGIWSHNTNNTFQWAVGIGSIVFVTYTADIIACGWIGAINYNGDDAEVEHIKTPHEIYRAKLQIKYIVGWILYIGITFGTLIYSFWHTKWMIIPLAIAFVSWFVTDVLGYDTIGEPGPLFK